MQQLVGSLSLISEFFRIEVQDLDPERLTALSFHREPAHSLPRTDNEVHHSTHLSKASIVDYLRLVGRVASKGSSQAVMNS